MSLGTQSESKQTKGERAISLILDRMKIPYFTEKSFKDLKGGKYRFDFYLPEQNVCIEFDGAQHFQFVGKFYRSRADFLKQQGHDRQKNSYCLANKIRLYRIPYWDMDKLKDLSDIFRDDYLVKTRWHNDEIWRKHQK